MVRDRSVNVREEIVEKGIRLFLRRGYHGTSIKDITDAVNISKGAFYWHFKSKDELLRTIVDHFERSLIDRVIEEVGKAEGDFKRKMKYSHKYVTEFAYQNRDLCVGFMAIAAEMTGSGTEVEKRIRSIYGKYRAFLRDLLEQGRREGAIRDELDLDLAAHVINAIHNGTLLEWYANAKQIDAGAFAVTYRDITLDGILKR